MSIGVSASARPYVFPESDDGIEIDIVREALSLGGYSFCPVYLPTSRSAQRFAHGSLEGLLNVTTSLHGGYTSDVIVTFKNCAFSLRDSNLDLAEVADLAGLAVAAFQRAAILLGHKFAVVIRDMANYQEVSDQRTQLYLLLRGRVDAIVLEERIFAYYYQQLLNEAESESSVVPATMKTKDIQQHCIFEASPYRIEFANKNVRDAFNAGLKMLRTSGRYREIIESYLGSGAS